MYCVQSTPKFCAFFSHYTTEIWKTPPQRPTAVDCFNYTVHAHLPLIELLPSKTELICKLQPWINESIGSCKRVLEGCEKVEEYWSSSPPYGYEAACISVQQNGDRHKNTLLLESHNIIAGFYSRLQYISKLVNP